MSMNFIGLHRSRTSLQCGRYAWP